MKMVRFSALRTGSLYPPENIPATYFCYRLSQPHCHSAAGRIISIKNSSDTIGNRTRDLPACSAVSKPTALPRAHTQQYVHIITLTTISIYTWHYPAGFEDKSPDSGTGQYNGRYNTAYQSRVYSTDTSETYSSSSYSDYNVKSIASRILKLYWKKFHVPLDIGTQVRA
jgi:hypothetical protein